MYTVYKISNSVTKQSYVGMTGMSLKQRMAAHFCRAKTGIENRSKLYEAMRKFGRSAFSVEILAQTESKLEAERLESQFVTDLGTFKNGYNSTPSGGSALIDCVMHLGNHAKKTGNPNEGAFNIKFPDGTVHVITGMMRFCRERGLNNAHLYVRGRTKGYEFLGRLRDYPEREYGQAAGKSGKPETV